VTRHPALCDRLRIKAYPTWFINGKRYEGVLSFDRLADLTDFPQ
jgi:protein-disulfide isomerase